METRTRLMLVDDGLPRPLANHPVLDDLGCWICEPDLQYPPPIRIAIEYEGEHHLRDKDQYRSDIRRDEVLRELGWVVIRLVASDVLGPRRALTVHRVRRALAAAGAI
jgi:hypothetical protein